MHMHNAVMGCVQQQAHAAWAVPDPALGKAAGWDVDGALREGPAHGMPGVPAAQLHAAHGIGPSRKDSGCAKNCPIG